MIKNDGGSGTIEILYPEKLGIWETILNGKADATWIFTNWEGIRAKDEGVTLNVFRMKDYGVPYGYSPILMAGKKEAILQAHTFSRFLEATKRGYLYAQEHPIEAVNCIRPYVAKQDSTINLMESQKFTSAYYGNSANWGLMEAENVNHYLDWLCKAGLEEKEFSFNDLVFNIGDFL